MMAKRCRWCGRFVPAGTPLTALCLRLANPDGTEPFWSDRWRTVVQMLCRECAEAWSVDLYWNQPVKGGAYE